jgi:hypothetical protein
MQKICHPKKPLGGAGGYLLIPQAQVEPITTWRNNVHPIGSTYSKVEHARHSTFQPLVATNCWQLVGKNILPRVLILKIN